MLQNVELNMEGNTLMEIPKFNPFRFKWNFDHLRTTPGKIKLAIMILPFVGFTMCSIISTNSGRLAERLFFLLWAFIATIVPVLSFLRFFLLQHESLPRWYRYRMLKSEFIVIALLIVLYIISIILVVMLGPHLLIEILVVCIGGILFFLGYGIYTWIRMERMELKLCGEAYHKYNSLPVHFMN